MIQDKVARFIYVFAVGFLAAAAYGLWTGLLVGTVVVIIANLVAGFVEAAAEDDQ